MPAYEFVNLSAQAFVYACVRLYACVYTHGRIACRDLCAHDAQHLNYARAHDHVWVCEHDYACVCVCVCVCAN